MAVEHPKYEPMKVELMWRSSPEAPYVSGGRFPSHENMLHAIQEFIRGYRYDVIDLMGSPFENSVTHPRRKKKAAK